jgi:hypothetical protein
MQDQRAVVYGDVNLYIGWMAPESLQEALPGFPHLRLMVGPRPPAAPGRGCCASNNTI